MENISRYGFSRHSVTHESVSEIGAAIEQISVLLVIQRLW